MNSYQTCDLNHRCNPFVATHADPNGYDKCNGQGGLAVMPRGKLILATLAANG